MTKLTDSALLNTPQPCVSNENHVASTERWWALSVDGIDYIIGASIFSLTQSIYSTVYYDCNGLMCYMCVLHSEGMYGYG